MTSQMTAGTVWGELSDGQPVHRFILRDGRGLEADILSFGATIAALRVPDRRGSVRNVVLGFPDLAGYVAGTGRLGAVVGRFANRIANGSFSLDGEPFSLTRNDGANTLHSGRDAYDKRVWDVVEVLDREVTLRLTSLDGDQGFPGRLELTVRYAVNDPGTLSIDYTAVTDRPTVLNVTNHAYFNLAGEDAGSILDHAIQIPADRLVAVDGAGIPTGELMPVAATPLDFTASRRIGDRIREPHPQIMNVRGYDHCYVLGDAPTSEPRPAAVLVEPESGRSLEVLTTEPGVQFYTGNSLTGALVGSGGRAYRQGDGLALETQHFPDSPNQPGFPSTVLRPGEVFRSTTLLRFGMQE